MKPKVIIIGGGIAGLSAVRVLLRHDYCVTLLEARDRLGGRIQSVNSGAGMIELGAEFLHGEDQALRKVIDTAGLTTREVSGDYRLAQDHHLKPVDFWGKMGRLIGRVDPKAPDLSFKEFLDLQPLNDSDRAQALAFVEGFHAAHPERISAHALLRGEYAAEHMPSRRQSRLDKGYSALVDFLAQEIQAHGGKIILDAPVESVQWQAGRVDVSFSREALQPLKADAAVITLPLGVLKAGTVKFDPALTQKHEAIDQIQFGHVIKSIHLFREKWWPDFGFILALNEPIPTWWADSRGPMLTGWAAGPKAENLRSNSSARIEALGLEILERLFPAQAAVVRRQHLATHTHDWSDDPWTRGAYSYLPVNGLDMPKLLGAPLAETLFFAGEATVTDGQTGTVFGAFETGLRAAREVIQHQP